MKFALTLLSIAFAGVALAADPQLSQVECSVDDYELTLSVNGTRAHAHVNRGTSLFHHYDGTVTYHLNKSNPPEHVWTVTAADGRRTIVSTKDEGGHRHGKATFHYNLQTSPLLFPDDSCHIDVE